MPVRPQSKRAGRAPRPTPEQARAEVLESRLHLSAAQVAPAATAPPLAPTSVDAGHAGPGEIRLAWTDRSADESGFVVGRRRIGEPTFTEVAVLPADTREFLEVPDPILFPAGTVLRYQVIAFNDAGPSPPETAFNDVTVGGPGGTGLRQRIWNDVDPASFEPLARPAVDRVDPYLNHAWGDGSPAPGIDPDTFAVEWVGEVVADVTRLYDFSVIANDGVRLFLDDRLVIAGGWRDQPNTEYFAEPVRLAAGQKVKIRLQAYDNAGPAALQLRWNGSVSKPREAVPTAFLLPTVAPGDAVASLPVRPVTFHEVFALPATATTPMSIGVHWQDNAFGETGYEIERAANGAFTQNKVRFNAPRGDHFTDRGGPDADGNPAPLEPYTTYYYRMRPAGSSSFVNAGAAATGEYHDDFTARYTLDSFFSPEWVTLNGYASTTAEHTLKLTDNRNHRIASAYLNQTFDVDFSFRRARFDFRIGESNGAEGMAFVIHNAAPVSPDQTQLNALGDGGSRLGYGGIPNSVAILFDVHETLDTMGVWVNGATPPTGTLAAYAGAIRTNPQAIAAPNGSFNLRDTANLTAGAAPINLDGGTRWRVVIDYDHEGLDADGDGWGSEGDTGLMTIHLSDASDATGKILFTATYDIDLATVIGSKTAVMGWTAATGDRNSKTEVYNFRYDGNIEVPTGPNEVFVRGTDWLGQDNNPGSTHFMEYLENKGLGDASYGYRLLRDGYPTTGPSANPWNLLPWINMNQVVLRYDGIGGWFPPTLETVTLTGRNSAAGGYAVTSVTRVTTFPGTYVLTLNKPLGGGDPATGAAPTAAENGDEFVLTLKDGFGGHDYFSLTLTVVQGEVDHLNEFSHRVLASDYTEVKKRFFKNTTSPVRNDGADYSPFHDLDASGSILARDYAEVKKRFFHALPPPPAAPTAAAGAAPPLFNSLRIQPDRRSALRDLLA